MRLSLLALLLTLLPALQSKYAFKTFYQEGNQLLGQGAYQEALDKFKEAYRLEQKAQRYKEEGAFFNDYLPRYKIALCYEHLDIAEAEAWVKRSEEAIEEDIIRRQKNVLADYHRDLDRIRNGAETFRKELATRYDIKLREAENLLKAHKFDQAKTAFQALLDIDPNRPEATVGLEKIGPSRENFLGGKVLEARRAILDRNFTTAEAVIGQIAQIDPSYSDIALLRGEITAAKDALLKTETTVEIAKNQKNDGPSTTNGGNNADRPKGNTDDRPKVDPGVKTQTESLASQQNAKLEQERRRASLRSALLDTLKTYRKGEPVDALEKLEGIELEGVSDSGSYQWLKGLYLLGAYRHALAPDQSLADRAREAMARAVELVPGFEPDPDLYPRYVLEFFWNAKNSRQ